MDDSHNFSSVPSPYGWFITATDTAHRASGNAAVNETQLSEHSRKQSHSIFDWITRLSWLPLWHLQRPKHN